MNIPNKIRFDNNYIRKDFLALRDLTKFFYESILDMEECLEEDFNPKSRKSINEDIYEDLFCYYCGCKDLYTILERFSNANDDILKGLVYETLSAIDTLNNFDKYYPV